MEISGVMDKLRDVVDKLNQQEHTHPAPNTRAPAANGLYFSRFEDAATANLITYWDPPTDDDTVPTTQASREAWIHRLVTAIKNNKGCLKANENRESKAFRIRWADNAIFYPPTAFEVVAWKILVSTH